ncbi:MAG: hypothetical protein PHR68_00935 [Candidatus Gracilibacteria bacterium]|nr:hypothetical protein [Candidatus Gracilibacteria bacterium]
MFIEIVNAAEPTTSALFSSKMELGDFILLAISMLVFFAGLFSIGYILRGGLLLILSGGKDDKMKPAINSIRYSIIGFIVIVLSIYIFPRIAGLLGLDVSKYSSPDKIFKQIKSIGDKVLGTGSNSSTEIDVNSSNNTLNELPEDFSDL